MKTNEVNVFVFIACIIVGILISLNINFGSSNNKPTVYLDSQQYYRAYLEKTKLTGDVTRLMNQYNIYNSKLNKYKSVSQNESQIVQEMNDEIQKNDAVLGKTNLQGQGVTIALNDASSSSNIDSFNKSELIHDVDIQLLINDLRSAGAEAISINGERVVENTDIICWHEFIKVNDATIYAPFYIDAIGNKDALEKYMKESTEVGFLRARGISISIKSTEKVSISAYEGNFSSKFMKEKIK